MTGLLSDYTIQHEVEDMTKFKCTSSSVGWFEEGCVYSFDGEYIHDMGCFGDEESYGWDVNVLGQNLLETLDGLATFVRVSE